ncbi:DHH phosphoesterase [Metschnikowia bicuspidata var. bicuspidata NRRL YB-4993]|uniref:DHH phosphoesterase n=1 Tax=Metschnikowia bicuspidata var. bicuspidata NRRL YB-4993 TaxID=869754 RepID=A0A1A0HCE9_9ASCO|nr:DHH phosphoesterase [Metschnikowia bicuspidata var. bicuspidata NRRL YB-4993]OBA21562.1 DHH phosphoesterase [Metschnikowia bicuspidata var. bicuspidata NRRL YB-4993]
MTIKTFLEGLRISPSSKHVVRFVAGNQSADMDSVVSAITYAYFHHRFNPKEQALLPLVNISREEFRLRKDIVFLLSKHEISSTRIFFLDDVEELTQLSPSIKLDVVLVDHCNLQGKVLTGLYENKRLFVSGIIDHHADEGVFLDAMPRVIQSNGSCSALVYHFWNNKNGPITDKDAVLLLVGPLLIDTSNMEQKVEAGDREAYVEYGQILQSPEALMQTDGVAPAAFSQLYSELKAAKKDLRGFSLYDILRKDYKQFKFRGKLGDTVNVGFSSIGKSLSWVLGKFSVSEVLESLKMMTESFHLDVVVITSSFSQKDTKIYTREFCFSTLKASLEPLASLAQELELTSRFYKDDTVARQMAQINGSVFFRVYDQQNTAASRKQVVPIIKQVVEQRL